jgi:hypothetical protein
MEREGENVVEWETFGCEARIYPRCAVSPHDAQVHASAALAGTPELRHAHVTSRVFLNIRPPRFLPTPAHTHITMLSGRSLKHAIAPVLRTTPAKRAIASSRVALSDKLFVVNIPSDQPCHTLPDEKSEITELQLPPNRSPRLSMTYLCTGTLPTLARRPPFHFSLLLTPTRIARVPHSDFRLSLVRPVCTYRRWRVITHLVIDLWLAPRYCRQQLQCQVRVHKGKPGACKGDHGQVPSPV